MNENVRTAELPRIEKRSDGQFQFLIDGEPFVILGLQWACESCFSKEVMNPLFAQAARLHANTAVLPLYWREVEPKEGRYDYAMIDERIRRAEENGLRVILLWFATWKNGEEFYAPDYIRSNPKVYRYSTDREGKKLVSLCPSCEATRERDARALSGIMAHLRDFDARHTVIMVQVENEPGIIGSDRCYCPECNERFERERDRWVTEWGDHAAEAFGASLLCAYIDHVAERAKAAHPLPLYMNVAFGLSVHSELAVPGREHFATGAVTYLYPLYRTNLKHVDIIAPDIYHHGYSDFLRISEVYATETNPYYVAETSSSTTGRAECNAFYAIGRHGAVGFDPWAIDSPFPERFGPPLVDPIGGEWGPQAYALRDSYHAISSAMVQIAEAQGTARIATFVQEAGDRVAAHRFSDCDVVVNYHEPEGTGRGIVIQEGDGTYIVVGVGFSVNFRTHAPAGRPIRIASVEKGRFEGREWRCLFPVEHYRVMMLEPYAARVRLEQ